MLNELQNNAGLKQYFSGSLNPRTNEYDDYQTSRVLRELVKNNPLIDSVYLYRTLDQIVVTPSTRSDLQTFPDKRFLGLTVSSKQPYQWTFRTLIDREGTGQGKLVVSLAKIGNLLDYSIIVVNISTEKLRELIESMADSKSTFVELTDAEGNPIVSTGGALGHAGKVLSEVYSSKTNWTVKSGNREGGFAELVSSLFYVWMGLGFVMILAGLLWIIYVSKRNYKPILSLMNRISHVMPEASEGSKSGKLDEFKFIEKTIEGLLDESNMLQEQHQENIVYRRRHLFLNMLEGAAGSNPKVWERELEQLGVERTLTGLSVSLVEVDHYAEFERQYGSDQHLLKHVLSKVVQEMAEMKPYLVWVEWFDAYRMAILAMYHQHEASEHEAKSFCEQLRQWVEQNLDFTITIGIGRPAGRLEGIAGSFREAVALAGYKSSLGINRIIMHKHLEAKPKGELFRQLQCIRAISQSFRAGEAEWEAHLGELYEGLQGQLYSHDDLSSLMQVLIEHLQKEVADLPEELYRVWRDEAYCALLAALEHKETLDEIYNELRLILQETIQKMNALREKKSTHQLVYQMKEYIGEHAHSPDLSLASVSEAFGFNAKYLSRLFRDAFGVKFVEYVTTVRMEKARQLLLETGHTVQEIGQAVGYEHSLTFIRVFKKHTGFTPGQFRKMEL